jgi:hypothetical protein
MENNYKCSYLKHMPKVLNVKFWHNKLISKFGGSIQSIQFNLMNGSFNEIDEFIKIYINHNQINSIVQVQNPNFNFKEEFKLNFI